MSTEQLENIFKEAKYNPEKIGVRILRECGYIVETYSYSDAPPTVRSKEGELLYA